jgi:hypothetical protein
MVLFVNEKDPDAPCTFVQTTYDTYGGRAEVVFRKGRMLMDMMCKSAAMPTHVHPISRSTAGSNCASSDHFVMCGLDETRHPWQDSL